MFEKYVARFAHGVTDAEDEIEKYIETHPELGNIMNEEILKKAAKKKDNTSHDSDFSTF